MDEPRDTERLRDYLAERDEPCPACNYNLRGLNVGRCPECNQELRLQVGLVELRLGAYLGALSGHMAGGGAAAIMVCMVIYGTLRFGPPSGREAVVLYVVPPVALLVHGGIVLALARIRGRMWFRSLDGGQRVWMIVGGWLLVGFFIGWFVVWID